VQTSAKAKSQPKVNRDSNPDFWINPNQDPDPDMSTWPLPQCCGFIRPTLSASIILLSYVKSAGNCITNAHKSPKMAQIPLFRNSEAHGKWPRLCTEDWSTTVVASGSLLTDTMTDKQYCTHHITFNNVPLHLLLAACFSCQWRPSSTVDSWRAPAGSLAAESHLDMTWVITQQSHSSRRQAIYRYSASHSSYIYRYSSYIYRYSASHSSYIYPYSASHSSYIYRYSASHSLCH